MRFENYEANGHGHNLELAVMLHNVQCVLHPRRIECRAKSVHLRPACTYNVDLPHQLLPSMFGWRLSSVMPLGIMPFCFSVPSCSECNLNLEHDHSYPCLQILGVTWCTIYWTYAFNEFVMHNCKEWRSSWKAEIRKWTKLRQNLRYNWIDPILKLSFVSMEYFANLDEVWAVLTNCGWCLLVIQIRADNTPVPETLAKKVRDTFSLCDDIIIIIIIVMVCLLSSWFQGTTPSWRIQEVQGLFWIIRLENYDNGLGFWICSKRVLHRLCGEEFQLNSTLAHIQGRFESISTRMCVKPLGMLSKMENINYGYNFSCLLTVLCRTALSSTCWFVYKIFEKVNGS